MSVTPDPAAPPSPGARVAVVAFYALVAAVAWALARRLGIDLGSTLRPDARALTLGVLALTPLLAWLGLVMTVEGLGFDSLRRATADLVRPLFAGLTPPDILVLSALAGFAEELLFRGVLQPWAAARFGLPAALVATNALFALLHALTPAYAAVSFLVGAYLGTAAALTDRLLVPMLAHGLYDAVALAWILHRHNSRKGGLSGLPGR